MYELNRETAIRWISQYETTRMDESRRLDCLCGLWYRPEDNEYYMLSEALQEELDNMDDFTNVMHLKWNPIILEYLITYEHRGDSNAYLKSRLLQMGLKDEFNVVGNSLDELYQCQCCDYFVPYANCPICGWIDANIRSEYDPTPNNRGLRLEVCKQNYQAVGNCYGEPDFSEWLDRNHKDRLLRFEKAR